jgi:hypothetical protein
VALTIALCIPSAVWCVGPLEIPVNPAAESSDSYPANDSAPAMHST